MEAQNPKLKLAKKNVWIARMKTALFAMVLDLKNVLCVMMDSI